MHRDTRHPGRVSRLPTVAALLSVLLVLLSPPAGAQVTEPTVPTPTVAPPTPRIPTTPGLPNGLRIRGALVEAPDRSDRRFTADQATAFLQSWLPESIFSGAASSPRPTSLPIATLTFDASYGNTQYQFRAFFACSGTSALVGMPAQGLWPGAFVDRERWFQPSNPARLLAAFNGSLPVVTASDTSPPTLPSNAKTTCRLTRATRDRAAETDSTMPVWIAASLVAVALVGALALGRRMTRRPANQHPDQT